MAYNQKQKAAWGLARQRANQAFIRRHKMLVGCTDCGFKGHFSALQYDHVRGAKVKNICQMLSRSRKQLKEEMSKCEVVCANCHAFRTWFRRYG